MKRISVVIAAIFAVLAFASCAKGGRVVYNSASDEEAAAGTWTVLVYMIGGSEETENGSASKKLEDIMSVNYSDNVRVVIETGGSAVWHEKGVYSDYLQRFEAGKNTLYLKDQTMAANMGDYRTLTDFLAWGLTNYKSENYMLILSGSGGGSMYGIGSDELFQNDCLNLEEIAYAMNFSGRNFDVVCTDASLMGSLETAGALSAYADYFVAPQDAQNFDSWDYAGFLNFMCENPTAEGEEIGKAICDSYYNRAVTKGNEKYVSISVIDVSNVSTLNQAFDGMAGDMLIGTDSLENYRSLSEALSKAHVYGGATEGEGFSDLIDLGDAALKIHENVGMTADLLLDTLSETVVYRVCGDEQSASSGLSFYYPLDLNNDRLQEYMDMSMSSKYKEFLRKICVNCSVSDATTNTSDYTSSWAWNTYNEDMAWLEYQTILDGNSYELYISGNMDLFRDVAINAYKQDKQSGKYIFAGKHHNIENDWEGGIFRDNFNGVLPEFAGKTISMSLVRSYDDYDLYSFPAAMNGKICHVRAKYDRNANRYEVIGVWSGLDSAGQVKSAIDDDSAPDKITPLLSVYDEERVRSEYILGSPARARGSLSDGKTDDGNYIFEYELTDIYGLKRYGTPVNARVSGRKVIYE